MPKPPMKDVITIYSPDGERDDYGRPTNSLKTTSIARVKHTTDVDIEREGTGIQSILIINIPPETKVEDGYEVEWVDRFGVVIKGAIEGIKEALNYGGDKVYYRTIYVNKSPSVS